MYLGMDSDSGTLMAVKQVSLGHSGSSSTKLAEHIKSLEAEVNLLKQLDHPNIVRYLGTDKTGKILNIFLEYVPGGSIASLLANFGSFKEPVVKLYTKQILLGLEYLHRNAIMHRDIKGANILVDNTGTVKLADFGASKKIEELVTVGSGANSVKGTPYWMAPEVITQTGHGRQADIWSVACTVIEMATGKPPWSQYGSQVSAMFHIAKSKGPPLIPHELSPECKDFLYLCFNRNWRERPSAETLLQHPFVSDVLCPTQAQFLPMGVPGAGQMAQVRQSSQVGQVGQVSQGQIVQQPRARRQLQMADVSQGPAQPQRQDQVQAQNEEQKAPSRLQPTLIASSQRKVALRASAPVFSAAVAREREAANVGVDSSRADSSANSSSSANFIAKMGAQAPKQAMAGAQGRMGPQPATAVDDNPMHMPSSPKPTYAAAVAGEAAKVPTAAPLKTNTTTTAANAVSAALLPNTTEASGANRIASRSATTITTTNNSNSSSERFNPMEEPEGIHQQAKLAIDSLKTAMGANSTGGATTASLGCRDGRNSGQASSIGGGISYVGVRASLTSASSGAASGTKSGSVGTIGTTGTSDSAGPIVYTVAGENSNDSSIPGLPWDVRESWASGGTIGTAVGGASGASGPSGASGASGASSGMTSRTITTSRNTTNSSGGADSAGITHTTGSTVVNARFDSSLDKSLDRGLDRSWSSTSSHDSLSERREGRMGSINMSSLHRPRSASGAREFTTPRKSQTVPRSAASTPGQTPSRIPRPSNRHSTPMTRKSPTKLAGGRHSMPTPGRQYAERLERKQSSGMAPPPPRNAYRKL